MNVLVIVILHLLAAGLALAGGTHGALLAGTPVIYYCAAWIFLLQWLAFVPAYLNQSEKYYDLVGSLTFISAVWLALLASGAWNPHSVLIALLVTLWAGRLGTFLFARIRQDGHDTRFDKIKPDPILFLRTWCLQGLWVLVTSGAALVAVANGGAGQGIGVLVLLGLALWILGFVIEVVADRQKRLFREQQGGGAFITTGLWSRSRHPNYFGEIMLWFGMALVAFPALQGWQYLTLVSPLFVYLLLARVSGIPLLERKARRRWGEDPQYQHYVASTPVLVPRLGGA